eukprot:8161952-Pyramimonas_sp.AAC.1
MGGSGPKDARRASQGRCDPSSPGARSALHVSLFLNVQVPIRGASCDWMMCQSCVNGSVRRQPLPPQLERLEGELSKYTVVTDPEDVEQKRQAFEARMKER